MNKISKRLVSLALVLVLLTGLFAVPMGQVSAVSSKNNWVTSYSNPDVNGDGTIKFLIIGNSYGNNIRHMLNDFYMPKQNKKVIVAQAYIGFSGMAEYYKQSKNAEFYATQFNTNEVLSNPSVYGSQSTHNSSYISSIQYQDVVKMTEWDIIMLQESPYGAARPANYTACLNGFVSAIKSAYAEAHGASAKMSMAWFMTWATPASLTSGDGYYEGTHLDQYNRISTCVNDYVAASGLFDVIYPAATMIQNARTAHTDNYVISSELKYDGMCTDNLHIVTVFAKTMAAYGLMKTLGLSTDNCNAAEHFESFFTGDVPAEFLVESEKLYRSNRMDLVMKESVDNAMKTPQTVTQSKYTGDVATTCNNGANHTYTGPVVTAPTCTEDGYTKNECTTCGYYHIYDATAKLGHNYKVTDEKAPTCTENGYVKQICSRCNDDNSQVLAGGHTYGNWEIIKEATRTQTGIKRKTCSACGTYYEEDIPLVTDNKTYDIAFETKADYDEFCADAIKASGYSGQYTTEEYMYFSEKDKAFITSFVPSSAGQNVANSFVAIKTPDNTYGKTFTMLSGGGYSYDTTTAAPGVIVGHDSYGYYGIKAYVASNGQVVLQYFTMSEPVSSTYGYNALLAYSKQEIVNISAMNGKEITPINVISKANYADLPIDGISLTNNNQQFFKYKYYVTGAANGTVSLKVDLIYDDLISQFTATTETVTFTADDAAALKTGVTHVGYSSAFGFLKQSFGNQLTYANMAGETVNHDHDSRVYSLYAEYAEKEACTHPATETVAGEAATCTKSGVADSVICTACGETVSGGEEIAALGHDYIENYTVKPTCTEKGEMHTTCSRCTYNITAAVPPTGHQMGEVVESLDPTCTNDGYQVGACSVCGTTSTETVPALGHDYGEFETTKEPTCTEKGSQTKSCSRCDAVVTVDIAAKGHTYSEWTVTKQPTDTEAGTKSRTCETCGDTQTAEVPMDSGKMKYDWVLAETASFNELKTAVKMVATKNIKYATWGGEDTVVDYNDDADAVAFNVSMNSGTTGFVIKTPTEGGAEAQPKTFKLSTSTYVPSASKTEQIGTDTLADIIFAKNSTGYFIFSYGPNSSHLAFQPFSTDTSDRVILSGAKTSIFSNLTLSAEKFSVNGEELDINTTVYTKRFTHQGNLPKAINQLIEAGVVRGTAVPTTTAEGVGTGAYFERFTADYEMTVAANNDITINYNVHYTTDKGDVVTFKMFPITLEGNIITFYKPADTPTTMTKDLAATLKDLSPIIPVFGTSTYPVNIQKATAYAAVDTMYAEYAEPCAHAKTTIVDAKEPTCTKTGNAKCVYCADCGQMLEGVIGGGTVEPLGHDYKSAVTLEPHCFADGSLIDGTLTYTCTRCSDSYAVSIPAAHDFSDWEIVTYADAMTEGLKKSTCNSCGAVISKVIPKATTFEYDWNYSEAPMNQKDADDTLSTLNFIDASGGTYSGDEYHEFNSETGSFDFIMPQGSFLAGMLPTPSGYLPRTFTAKAYSENYGNATTTPGIFFATDENASTPTYYYFQAYLLGSASYYKLWVYTRSTTCDQFGNYRYNVKYIANGKAFGLKTAVNFNNLSNFIGSEADGRYKKLGLYFHLPTEVEYSVTVDDKGVPTINTKLSLIDLTGKRTTLDMMQIVCDNTTLGLASDAKLTPMFGIASQAGTLMDSYGEQYPELLTGNEDKCKYEYVHATYEFDKDSPDHVHTYNNGVTIEPTCTTTGGVKFTCTMCGHNYIADEIPALGHDLTTETTPPTCLNSGTSVTTCSRCSYREVVTLPATGHAYENPTITKQATCTEDGILTGTCVVCGMSGDEAIPAFGHSYTEWIIDKAPTITETGSRHKTCETCGDVVTEVIPVLILTKDYSWDFETSNGSQYAKAVLENGTHYVSNNKGLATEADKQTVSYNSDRTALEIAVPSSVTNSLNAVVFNTPGGTVPMTFSAEFGTEQREDLNRLYSGGVVYATDNSGFYHIALNHFGAFKHYMYYTKTTSATTSSGDYVMLPASTTVVGGNGITPWFMRVYKNGELVSDRETSFNAAGLENYAKFRTLIATDLPASITNDLLLTTRTRYDVTVEDGITKIITTLVFTTEENVYELELSPVRVTANGTMVYQNNHLEQTYSYSENNHTNGLGYKSAFGIASYKQGISDDVAVQVYNVDAKYRITGEHTHTLEVRENVESTCTKGGYTLYGCSECSYTYEEATGEALGHDITTTSFEATCEKSAGTVSTCSRCDYNKEVLEGNPLGHDLTTVTTEPTCDKAGGMVITCSRCDYTKENLVGAALGHDYQETTIAATCGSDGSVTNTCSRCGDTSSVTLPATGNHNFVLDEAQSVAPTFTADGYNLYVCTGCGKTEKETVPATGAGEFDENLPYWEKLVTVDGDIVTLKITLRGPDKSCAGGQVDITYPAEKLEYICPGIAEDNSELYDEDLGWLGIGWGFVNGHTDPGLFIANFFNTRGVATGRILCEVKFKLISGTISAEDFAYTEIIGDSEGVGVSNPTPVEFVCLHTNTENVLKADATCTAAGTSIDKCSSCGKEVTSTIPALGHDLITETVDATCTAVGTTTTTCSRCDYKDVKTTPKLDHTESEWITDKAPTAAEAGSAHKECTVCGEILGTKVLDKLDMVYGDYDGDGIVAINDVVMLGRYASNIAELPEERKQALDVNSDGKINTGDAVLIARKLAGIVDSFPVEQ